MKNILTIKNLLMVLAVAVFAACSGAPESDEAQVGDAQEVQAVEAVAYAIDLTASEIAWIGTKTTGRHNGTVKLSGGTLQVQGTEIVGGDFTMDMTTIKAVDADEENNAKLAGHLMSGDFFKVDEFPTATFVLTGVTATTEAVAENPEENTAEIDQYKVTNPTHMVSGNLTIRDVTRGITFPAQVTMTENGVTAIAKFNINRKDWNLDWEIPVADVVLNNTIHLGINLVAAKPAA